MVATFKPKSDYRVIGTRPIRHDGLDKVTGRAVYGADIKLPGMLWGVVVRSPYAHALIKNIDTTVASAMDGVFAVITAKDLPTIEDKWASNNVMAKEKVHYKGHAVAAVAAADRYLAEEAARAVSVEYEVLECATDVVKATQKDAPIILQDLVGDHLGEEVKDTNIASQTRYEFGDLKTGFAEADHIVEREYAMQMVHQGYVEPHNATGIWDEDNRIRIWTSTQGAFPVRTDLAKLMDMPESRIRVTPLEIGGGFGGKIPIYLEPIVVTLSKLSAGRPIKAIMDRKSVFEASGPAPGGLLKIKVGSTKSGKLTAATADIWLEAGGYPGAAVDPAAQCVFAPYDIPNTRIDGYDVVVNKPKSAAYRAPGSPQAAFAMESAVDELCDLGGFDKLEFRLNNASKEGTRRGDGVVFPRIGNIEVIEAAKKSDHWNSPLGIPAARDVKRGRGVASGYWFNVGLKSSVNLALNADGTVQLLEGSTDIGGTRASISMQAAEVLGIAAEDVRPTVADTDSIGYTDVTGGSRTTYATGYAAWEAANSMIDVLKKRAALIWAISVDDVYFQDGLFSSKTDPELKMSFKEISAKLDDTGGPVNSTGSVDLESAGGAFAVHIVDLDIDMETGKTDVVRYTAVQDVGKAIHPSYVEGQIQGGVAQGIGWALNEEYFMTENGVMANSSYLDYRVPTALDMPNIETVIVEVANPIHPFGVRGVGEVPIAPPLPAIANAINDTINVRLYETPMKAGNIIKALGK